jgi:hypothetical protein
MKWEFPILIAAFAVLLILWIILYWKGWTSTWGNQFVKGQLDNPLTDIEVNMKEFQHNFDTGPIVMVEASASHIESREGQHELESFEEEIFEDEQSEKEDVNEGERQNLPTTDGKEAWKQVTLKKLTTKKRRKFIKTEKKWREYGTRWSEWGRKDEGGGKLPIFAPPIGHKMGKKVNEEKTEVLWTASEEYRYGSWQENAADVQFPDTDVVTATTTLMVDLRGSAAKKVEEIKKALTQEGYEWDTTINTDVKFSVPDWQDVVPLALNTERVIRIRDFHAGKCGRFLWYVFLFFGYQSSWECFCNLGYEASTVEGEPVSLKCRKSVSDLNDQRAGYGQHDLVAAEQMKKALAKRLESLTPADQKEAGAKPIWDA